jgi:hypothetical protein
VRHTRATFGYPLLFLLNPFLVLSLRLSLAPDLWHLYNL